MVRRPGKASVRSGFTLLEVMIGGGILIFAALALSQATVQSMKLSLQNRETALAQAAARQAIEDLQARDFADIFVLFNSVDGDDPVGFDAPGATFDVPGLTPRAPGLTVGRILLPEVVVGATSRLDENYQDQAMGMPRDLDGDGVVDDDGTDHKGDYQILPVRVRLEWTGKGGDRVFEVRTMVSAR
jgi:type II secretory pathway pseudopilin PulG